MESYPRQSPFAMHSDTGENVQQQYVEPSISSEALRRSNRDVHTEVKPHRCEVCGETFETKRKLYWHRGKTHTKGLHACVICGKSFGRKCDLVRHQSIHFNRKRYECDKCKKKLSTKRSLHIHTTRKHMEQEPYKYVCEICNKVFSTEHYLKCHKYIHTDKKLFQCSICDKGYMTEISVLEHMEKEGHMGIVIKTPACL